MVRIQRWIRGHIKLHDGPRADQSTSKLQNNCASARHLKAHRTKCGEPLEWPTLAFTKLPCIQRCDNWDRNLIWYKLHVLWQKQYNHKEHVSRNRPTQFRREEDALNNAARRWAPAHRKAPGNRSEVTRLQSPTTSSSKDKDPTSKHWRHRLR